MSEQGQGGQANGARAEDTRAENTQASGQQQGSGDTKRTVIIAGAANIVVAVIKAVAGVLTGSSAMLAEAAHSVADTLNQAFLLTSIFRSSARPTRSTRSATARNAISGPCWPRSESSCSGPASRCSRAYSP